MAIASVITLTGEILAIEQGTGLLNGKGCLLRGVRPQMVLSRWEGFRDKSGKRSVARPQPERMAYMDWIPCASLSQRSSVLMNSASALICDLSREGKGALVSLRKLKRSAQRFALGRYGGALPRTPANFRLRKARFAGRCSVVHLLVEAKGGRAAGFRPAVAGGVGRLSPGSDWLTDCPDFGRTALRSPMLCSGICRLVGASSSTSAFVPPSTV